MSLRILLTSFVVLSGALAAASCGGDNEQVSPVAVGGGGGAETSSGGGGRGGAGGGGGAPEDPCDADGVSKGPWVQQIDGTHARVRWESCRVDADKGVSISREDGAGEQVLLGAQSEYDVTDSFSAPLNPEAPPDLAGTYWLHEVAIDALTPDTCYVYSIHGSPNRRGRFCTARPSGAPLRFMAIGDTNPGLNDVTAGILEHVLPMKPEFIVHGGDVEYYESGLDTWNYWFEILQPMLAQGAFYPAIGNHESENDDEYQRFSLRYFGDAGFTGDSTHYTFETAGVHFFCLDTQESIYPGGLQGTWLTQELDKASKSDGFRFSIVYFHKPLVTCGDTGDDPVGRAMLEPIFEQFKVALVLQAHMHGYERFEFGDLTYVTTGGGGGLIQDVDANISRDYCGDRVASGPYHHALILDVGDASLAVKAIGSDGAVVDSFEKALP